MISQQINGHLHSIANISANIWMFTSLEHTLQLVRTTDTFIENGWDSQGICDGPLTSNIYIYTHGKVGAKLHHKKWLQKS